MISYVLHSAFAGLWPLLWHYGLAGFLVICALAWAYFMPVFKKTALWVAVVIVTVMVAFTVGVKDGEYRVRAQWELAKQAAIKEAETARSDAERDVGGPVVPAELRNDRYNRDRKQP